MAQLLGKNNFVIFEKKIIFISIVNYSPVVFAILDFWSTQKNENFERDHPMPMYCSDSIKILEIYMPQKDTFGEGLLHGTYQACVTWPWPHLHGLLTIKFTWSFCDWVSFFITIQPRIITIFGPNIDTVGICHLTLNAKFWRINNKPIKPVILWNQTHKIIHL